MALAAGARLGPYEIQSALGAGGMGEVYRAKDTKLGRDVALKILPASFTGDPERVARFRREAHVLASLNHPHIAQIYGLEDANGTQFLVLELVDGEILDRRIARGPIPLDEAVGIAKQIIEALDVAHEKGIIHRDIKPANIALTADGSVKVLDFGLAKAVEMPSGAAFDAMNSPTITSPALMTSAGVILGTAAYMAPEQAKGRAADKRSDVWAFGCVLYEMLTGTRAFVGDDVPTTLATIMMREPNWHALPAGTPFELRRLLRHCLEKNPTRRLRDIADARLDLDDRDLLPDAPTARTRGLGQLVLWAASAAALGSLITGATVWNAMRLTSVLASRVLSFNIPPPPGVDYSGGEVAISPDGTRVVFPAVAAGTNVSRLYIRDLRQLNATPVADTDGAAGPFFSPDGEWLAFVANGRLRKVALQGTGEPPVTISNVAPLLGTWPGLQGASWGADNTIVFSAGGQRGGGLYRVSAAGGEPVALTAPDSTKHEQRHAWPTLLPGGKAVLFSVLRTGQLTFADARVDVLSLETGTHHTVIERGYHAHFVSNGYIVYTQDESDDAASVRGISPLMAVPFDVNRLVASGPPVPVVQSVKGQTILGDSYFDVSSNGVLVYAPDDVSSSQTRRLVWVDRQGREEVLAAAPHAYLYPRISPDGLRVAVSVMDADSDIWIWDVARQTLNRLTLGGIHYLPAWTPDGRRIAFASKGTASDAPYNVFWQDASGSTAAERLGSASATSQFPYQFSRDGRRLLLQDTDQTSVSVHVLHMDDNRQTEVVLKAGFNQRAAALSPDGRFLAFQSNESGRGEVYVRPFPSVTDGRWKVSTAGGDGPVWNPAGRELFYVNVVNGLMHVMEVSIQPGPTFDAGTPRELFAGRYVDFYGLNYDVSPDGRRLLMVKSAEEVNSRSTTSPGLVVIANWPEEMKARVPTK